MTKTKTRPLLLAGASVLLRASSSFVVVSEIDRAIAWIVPGSPRHNNNRYCNSNNNNRYCNQNQNQIQLKTQNKNNLVFLFSTFDESSTENLQEPQPSPPPAAAAGQFSKHNTNTNTIYSTGSKEDTKGAIENQHERKREREHGISKQPTLPAEPMVLEERLLSDHAALESFLSETETDHETKQPTTIPDAPFVAQDVPREAARIDPSVYEFNNNLVNLLFSAISFLYPTPLLSQPLLAASLSSPLLGTEYNEEKTTLRFEKFYVLETVARIPYFAYLSVLHLRETFGDRGGSKGPKKDIDNNQREDNDKDEDEAAYSFSLANHQRIETMRTHYAQADNGSHHLLIMEALGGDSIREIDRFLAHTTAFFYYWFVVVIFSCNEQAAYHLNEVVEDHAYKIYEEVSNSAR